MIDSTSLKVGWLEFILILKDKNLNDIIKWVIILGNQQSYRMKAEEELGIYYLLFSV